MGFGELGPAPFGSFGELAIILPLPLFGGGPLIGGMADNDCRLGGIPVGGDIPPPGIFGGNSLINPFYSSVSLGRERVLVVPIRGKISSKEPSSNLPAFMMDVFVMLMRIWAPR